MKALILCLQFLTKLPLPFVIEGEDDLFARGMKYFPVAGLIIGGFDCLTGWLCLKVFSTWAASLFVLIADTFITGGLHIDGLADTTDSFSSHRSRERMLEIMKDSRIGTFGVTGVLMVLAVKLFMYHEWLEAVQGAGRFGLLVVVPVVSRTMMAVLIYVSDYARKEGMGGLYFAYKDAMNLPAACIIGVVLCLPGICFQTARAAASILCGAVSAVLCGVIFRMVCYRKIGGMTGDTLGASLEWMEMVMLTASCAAYRIIGGL